MRNSNAKDITLIGLFIAISVVTRIGLSGLLNVQITTGIIILVTLNYGLKYGLSIALITPILSNLYLGSGIWTVWQMVCWSVVVLLTYPLKRYKDSAFIVGSFGLLMGYVYGIIMTIQSVLMFGLYGNTILGYYIAGLPYDTSHAISNLVFCIVFMKPFSWMVKTFQK